MTSSPAPGTLFRAFNAEKTEHATAVLLKNGSILQVKNVAGDAVRAVYPSMEGWLAAVHADPTHVVTDTAAAQGVVISADTHGFNYVRAERRYQVPDKNRWTNWCYERMAEITPQFLAREDVRAAYNTLVAVCGELPNDDIYYNYIYNEKPNKYKPDNFRWLDGADFGGFPCSFNYHNITTKVRMLSIAERIKVAYKALYDLVGEELRRKLQVVYDLTTAEKQMKNYAQRARRLQKKMMAMQAEGAAISAKLEVYTKKMEELKATL